MYNPGRKLNKSHEKFNKTDTYKILCIKLNLIIVLLICFLNQFILNVFCQYKYNNLIKEKYTIIWLYILFCKDI